MVKPINLHCIIPCQDDATSFYRGIGPIQELRRRLNLNILVNPEFSWASLKAADAVFAQRPATDTHLKAIKMTHANKRPLWVDYDDNYTGVPLCNRQHANYGNVKTEHNIAQILSMATAVTVSTEALADTMRRTLRGYGGTPANLDKIKVVPNAYDEELFPLTERSARADLVVWRGGNSHDKDLMLYTPQIVNIMKRFPATKFDMMGDPFWWTLEQMYAVDKERVTHTPAMPLTEYFAALKLRRPKVVIVPLEDSHFNHCKSNIAWQEATAAGALTLAPAWDEWRRPGVVTYESPEDFEDKLASILAGDFIPLFRWEESRDYIVGQRTLAGVNHLREAVLKSLVGLE